MRYRPTLRELWQRWRLQKLRRKRVYLASKKEMLFQLHRVGQPGVYPKSQAHAIVDLTAEIAELDEHIKQVEAS